MEIQKSTGVVLSTSQMGEADRSSKIFTKEYGKRVFIFKGLNKSRKRPQSVTEPGTIINVVYYYSEKRDLYVVNEFSIFKHYSEIRKDLAKIYTLLFILEITEKTTGLSDPNLDLFNLLVSGIETLAKTEYVISLSLFFTVHLLRVQGILSDFSRCKTCARTYNEFIIDVVDFRPICKDCSRTQIKNRNLLFLNGDYRDLLKMIVSKKFITLDHSLYRTEEVSHILYCLILFVENYFHIEIRTKRYVLTS
jgi:DNA repair protein RecO